jgi:alkanesulfonate monooxygenase SsuD/methylene tetrahydromethanopterin reductase-like flavin-dependent oxidoreductase (luciferase family)
LRIGYHLTPFWSPAERGASRVIDEAIEVISATATLGFEWVSLGQHYLSYPSAWPAPIPFLARLAPVSGNLRLKTSVLLLPMLNPVLLAEDLATLDHICKGRLDVGVAIGYRPAELQAAGITRADRAPKLEESLELMKRLWSGEEVTFQGRYTTVEQARMGFRPYQLPHPPIEFGAQSVGATRRAARLGEAVLFGPQASWTDVYRYAALWREERAAQGKEVGLVGASRSLMVGKSYEDAAGRARQYLERTFQNYTKWEMQERGMAELQLSFDIPLTDWSLCGSASEVVAAIQEAQANGLNGLGFTIYSLPPEPAARIEYLQMIAEEIVAKVAGPAAG